MRYNVKLGELVQPAPRAEEWAWQTTGACRGTDPSLFFDGTRDPKAELQAKVVCATCQVLERCLKYAVDASEPYGIWGGLTPHERDRYRRQRKWFAPAQRVATPPRDRKATP